jgi:hypothetical protein
MSSLELFAHISVAMEEPDDSPVRSSKSKRRSNNMMVPLPPLVPSPPPPLPQSVSRAKVIMERGEENNGEAEEEEKKDDIVRSSCAVCEKYIAPDNWSSMGCPTGCVLSLHILCKEKFQQRKCPYCQCYMIQPRHRRHQQQRQQPTAVAGSTVMHTPDPSAPDADDSVMLVAAEKEDVSANQLKPERKKNRRNIPKDASVAGVVSLDSIIPAFLMPVDRSDDSHKRYCMMATTTAQSDAEDLVNIQQVYAAKPPDPLVVKPGKQDKEQRGRKKHFVMTTEFGY